MFLDHRDRLLLYGPPPQHGVDGWVLEDMEWDPETGLSIFEYSSTTGKLNVQQVRSQPTHEGHINWELLRHVPVRVLTRRK